MVKRLRHGPLKAETGVRFSHGSPKQKGHHTVSFLFCHPWSHRTSHRSASAQVCGSSKICLVASVSEAFDDEADSPTRIIDAPYRGHHTVSFLFCHPWSHRTSHRSASAQVCGSSKICLVASVSEAFDDEADSPTRIIDAPYRGHHTVSFLFCHPWSRPTPPKATANARRWYVYTLNSSREYTAEDIILP